MVRQRVFRLQQQLNTLIETGVVAPATEEVDDWDAFDAPAPSTSSAPARSHILFSADLDTGSCCCRLVPGPR